MGDANINLEELLERHGVRLTPNRLLVARELLAIERPLSLTELEERIESVDKSGIFRTLVLFKEKHLVHTIDDGGEGTRYELCLSHDEHHDEDAHVHFFCEKCHRTFCLEDIPVPEVPLPEGYSSSTVSYLIKGICPECS